jgi:hypothetical protein
MMSFTEDTLEYHIRQASNRIGYRVGDAAPLFIGSAKHSVPTLRKGQTNRILLYSGGFNPPHEGHLRLLETSFQRSILGHIAVIILPYEERLLAEKLEPGDVSLTISERASLWQAGLPPSLRSVTWPASLGYEKWEGFRKELLASAQSSGYKIEVDGLWGSDNVEGAKANEPFSFGSLGTHHAFVSDITREWWAKPPGRKAPKQLYGCEEWFRVDWSATRAFGGWKSWRTWLTKSASSNGVGLFYLESPELRSIISSTKIREMIRRCGGEDVEEALKNGGLWQQIVNRDLWLKIVGVDLFRTMLEQRKQGEFEVD